MTFMFARALRSPLGRILLGLAACTLVPLAAKALLSPVLSATGLPTDAARALRHGLTIAVLYFSYVFCFRLLERRSITELSFRNFPREAGVGLAMGFTAIGGIFFILFIVGAYSSGPPHPSWAIVFAVVSMTMFVFFEEVLFRGVLYRILEDWRGTVTALLISAVVFGLTHITNAAVGPLGISSAVFGGALMGILFTWTRRLWVPTAFHIAWNLGQVLLLGNVSGEQGFVGLFDGRVTGPRLLVGSAFGVEDSLLGAGMPLVLFIGFFFLARRGGRVRSRTPEAPPHAPTT